VPSFLPLALTQAKWSKKQIWKGQKCPYGCTRVKDCFRPGPARGTSEQSGCLGRVEKSSRKFEKYFL